MTLGVVPPFDPEAERWGLNALMFTRFAGTFTDYTRWFDLHGTGHILTHRPDAYRWYAEQTKPIYRWRPDPALPTCLMYPRECVQAYFHGDRDFAGSLSWMLALAIYEGFEAIELFWFPMDDDAHRRQVASARYWIGQARGRGIAVTVHGDSALTPSGPLYGIETT